MLLQSLKKATNEQRKQINDLNHCIFVATEFSKKTKKTLKIHQLAIHQGNFQVSVLFTSDQTIHFLFALYSQSFFIAA
jgi:HD superfamily phosphohydrolase YqeK